MVNNLEIFKDILFINYKDLNLKKEDMQIMIENLKKSNLESVTTDELFKALYKFN